MNVTRMRTALMLSCALIAVAPLMAPAALAPAAMATELTSFADLVATARPAAAASSTAGIITPSTPVSRARLI